MAAESNSKTGILALAQKRLARTKTKVLQNLGKAEKTTDDVFNDNVLKVERQQEVAHHVQKELKSYAHCLREMSQASKSLVTALSEIYEPEWTKESTFKAQLQTLDLLWNDLLQSIQDSVIAPIHSYLQCFPVLKAKVAKRGRKMVDYDNCRHHLEVLQATKKKDDVKIHKAQEEMKDSKRIYEELNNELRTELPDFNNSRITFCASVLSSMFGAEHVFHSEIGKVNEKLFEICQELSKDFEQFVYQPKKALSKSISSNSGQNGFSDDISGAQSSSAHLARESLNSQTNSPVKEQNVYKNEEVPESKQPKRKAPIAPKCEPALEKIPEILSSDNLEVQQVQPDTSGRSKLAECTYKYFCRWKYKFTYRSFRKSAAVKYTSISETQAQIDFVEVGNKHGEVHCGTASDHDHALGASVGKISTHKEVKGSSLPDQPGKDRQSCPEAGFVYGGEHLVLQKNRLSKDIVIEPDLSYCNQPSTCKNQTSEDIPVQKIKPLELQESPEEFLVLNDGKRKSRTGLDCYPEGLQVGEDTNIDSAPSTISSIRHGDEAERVKEFATQIMNPSSMSQSISDCPKLDSKQQLSGVEELEAIAGHVRRVKITLSTLDQMAEVCVPKKDFKSCLNLSGQDADIKENLPRRAVPAIPSLDKVKSTSLASPSVHPFILSDCLSGGRKTKVIAPFSETNFVKNSDMPAGMELVTSASSNRAISGDVGKLKRANDTKEDTSTDLNEMARKRLHVIQQKVLNGTRCNDKDKLLVCNDDKDMLSASVDEGCSQQDEARQVCRGLTGTHQVERELTDNDGLHTFCYFDRIEGSGQEECSKDVGGVASTSYLRLITADTSDYYKMAYVDISSSAEDQSCKKNVSELLENSSLQNKKLVFQHQGVDAAVSVTEPLAFSNDNINVLTQHLVKKHNLTLPLNSLSASAERSPDAEKSIADRSTSENMSNKAKRSASSERSVSNNESFTEITKKQRIHQDYVSSSLASSKLNFLNNHLMKKHSLCPRNPDEAESTLGVQTKPPNINKGCYTQRKVERHVQGPNGLSTSCGNELPMISGGIQSRESAGHDHTGYRHTNPIIKTETGILGIRASSLQKMEIRSEMNKSLQGIFQDLLPEAWRSDSMQEDYHIVTVITEDLTESMGSYSKDNGEVLVGSSELAQKNSDRKCESNIRVDKNSDIMVEETKEFLLEKQHSGPENQGTSKVATDVIIEANTNSVSSECAQEKNDSVTASFHNQAQQGHYNLSPSLPSSKLNLDCVRFTKSNDKTSPRNATGKECSLSESSVSLDVDIDHRHKLEEKDKSMGKKAEKVRSNVCDDNNWSLKGFVHMLLPQTVQMLASHTKSYINSCVHSKPSDKYLEEIHKIVIECLTTEDYQNMFQTSSEGSSVDIVGKLDSPKPQPETDNVHSQSINAEVKLVQSDVSCSEKEMLFKEMSHVKFLEKPCPVLHSAAEGTLFESQKSPNGCHKPLEDNQGSHDSDVEILEKHFQTVLKDIITKGSGNLRKIGNIQSPSSGSRFLRFEKDEDQGVLSVTSGDLLSVGEDGEKDKSMSLHEAMLSRLQMAVPVLTRSQSRPLSEQASEDISLEHITSWTLSGESHSKSSNSKHEDMNEESFKSCQEDILKAEERLKSIGTVCASMDRISVKSSDVLQQSSDMPQQSSDMPQQSSAINFQACMARRRNAVGAVLDDEDCQSSSSQDEGDLCSNSCQSHLRSTAASRYPVYLQFSSAFSDYHCCSADIHEDCSICIHQDCTASVDDKCPVYLGELSTTDSSYNECSACMREDCSICVHQDCTASVEDGYTAVNEDCSVSSKFDVCRKSICSVPIQHQHSILKALPRNQSQEHMRCLYGQQGDIIDHDIMSSLPQNQSQDQMTCLYDQQGEIIDHDVISSLPQNKSQDHMRSLYDQQGEITCKDAVSYLVSDGLKNTDNIQPSLQISLSCNVANSLFAVESMNLGQTTAIQNLPKTQASSGQEGQCIVGGAAATNALVHSFVDVADLIEIISSPLSQHNGASPGLQETKDRRPSTVSDHDRHKKDDVRIDKADDDSTIEIKSVRHNFYEEPNEAASKISHVGDHDEDTDSEGDYISSDDEHEQMEALYSNPVSNNPLTCAPPNTLYMVQATHKYTGEDEDELCFEAGEIIYVTQFENPEEQDDGWQMGTKASDGVHGVFPENFTQKLIAEGR